MLAVLESDPWRIPLDISVQFSNYSFDIAQGFIEGERIDVLKHFYHEVCTTITKLSLLVAGRSTVGYCAVAVLGDHVDESVGEIAKVIRQRAFVALTDKLFTEFGVAACRHIAHQKVPKGIRAENTREVQWFHDVSNRFGHLRSVHVPPTMGEDGPGRRKAYCLEHRQPIDGVEYENVLADQVRDGRPQALETTVVGPEAYRLSASNHT